MKKFIIFLFLFYRISFAEDILNKTFTIVVASFKNAKWYKENIESLFQDYPNFNVIYIDDCSPDNTGILVEDLLKEKKINYNVLDVLYHDNLTLLPIEKYIDYLSTLIRIKRKDCQFLIVKNSQRKLALHNLVMAIYACDDSEIIVEVDGDDSLAHHNVLKKLNEVYGNPDVCLTYGQFKNLSNNKICMWNKKIPDNVIRFQSIRRYPHLPTHLRTFYAGLFKKIKLEDLRFKDKFYEMTWDVAFMMPMIEMAGEGARYISEPLLIYNDLNDINDHKVNRDEQLNLNKFIRKQQAYRKI